MQGVIHHWQAIARRLATAPARLRVLAFLLLLALLWLPWVGLVNICLRTDENQANIVRLVGLYGLFLWLLPRWSRGVHQQSHPWSRYGLGGGRRNLRELGLGLGLGLSSLTALFSIETLLGWVTWQPPSLDPFRLGLESLLVGLGIGFAEELLFRGWLLDELERDGNRAIALGWTTGLYAIAHGWRWQFPALCLLGLTLGWAKWACTEGQGAHQRSRLGLSIGIHAGLVGGYYVINVGKLVRYAELAPTWLTGLEGNPLAGVLGLSLMAMLACGLWWRWQRAIDCRMGP